MTTDLNALAKAIAPVTTGLVFVAHPKQAAAINLNRGVTFPNVEVWPTLGVAAGTVIALDPAAFVSAFGPEPEISASTETLAAHGKHDAVADRHDRCARLGRSGARRQNRCFRSTPSR